MTKINLYTMHGCPSCNRLKNMLLENGVIFNELSNDENLQELLDNGITKVPVIQIGSEFFVGPKAILKAEEIINDCQKER